mgnify:CR=1 FL=1
MLTTQGANTHLLYKNKKIIAQRVRSTDWELVKDNRVAVGALCTSFVALGRSYPEGGTLVSLRLGEDNRDPHWLDY